MIQQPQTAVFLCLIEIKNCNKKKNIILFLIAKKWIFGKYLFFDLTIELKFFGIASNWQVTRDNTVKYSDVLDLDSSLFIIAFFTGTGLSETGDKKDNPFSTNDRCRNRIIKTGSKMKNNKKVEK